MGEKKDSQDHRGRTFYLTTELDRKLRMAAAEEQMSVSQLVVLALEGFIRVRETGQRKSEG